MKYVVLALCLVSASYLAAQDGGRGADGHYHDPTTGAAQPDMCDNGFKNTHPCKCSRTTECDPHHMKDHPSDICQTYCRTDACRCVTTCGS